MAWWLTPRTPDPEVGGSSPTRVLEQDIFTPPPPQKKKKKKKVLVTPRKQWLRSNMTEKLFTGKLSIKPKKTKTIMLQSWVLLCTGSFFTNSAEYVTIFNLFLREILVLFSLCHIFSSPEPKAQR